MLVRTYSKAMNSPYDGLVLDSTNGTYFLFNAKYINGIVVRATTKSSFMFDFTPLDPRSRSTYVESEDTAANLVTRADYTWNSSMVALPLYPNNDSSQSTVTTYINCDSIVFVMKDPQNATRTLITYYEGNKRRVVLCSRDLNQVYALCDYGTLTTS